MSGIKSHSDDELLDFLKEEPLSSSDKNEIIMNKDSIHEFVLYFNIEAGDDLIAGDHLYTLFNKWSKVFLHKKSFFNELCKFLTYKKKLGKFTFFYNKLSFKLESKTLGIISGAKDINFLSQKFKNQIELFLSENSINRGNNYVNGDILFALYEKWMYNRKKAKLDSTNFHKLISLYLDKKYLNFKGRNNRAYGINKEET